MVGVVRKQSVRALADEDTPGVGIIALVPDAYRELRQEAVKHGFNEWLAWRSKYCTSRAVGPFGQSPEMMAWTQAYLGWTTPHDNIAYVSNEVFTGEVL